MLAPCYVHGTGVKFVPDMQMQWVINPPKKTLVAEGSGSTLVVTGESAFIEKKIGIVKFTYEMVKPVFS